MKNKKTIKFLVTFFALAAGTMIYLYAQNGYFFKKPSTDKENNVETGEMADDIGVPTGDDPWKEMDKLVTAYYDKQGVSFKGTIKLIDDNGDKEKIIEEHSFEYAVLNDNFYYSLGQMEVINKKDFVMVVDNANKFISLSSHKSQGEKAKQLFDIKEFKKLMEERKASVQVTQLGDQKILTIENIEDPQVQGYRIYYNPLTNRISKMLIGMIRLAPLEGDEEGGVEELPENANSEKETTIVDQDENSEPEVETFTYYMEIIYADMKILSVKEGAFNPQNKFIRVVNNKIELMPAYSGYQLMNNTGPKQETTDDISEEQ